MNTDSMVKLNYSKMIRKFTMKSAFIDLFKQLSKTGIFESNCLKLLIFAIVVAVKNAGFFIITEILVKNC